MARGRPRSEAERRRALAIYEQDGLAAASQQTGIPKQTIQQWASSDGLRTAEPAKTAAATATHSRTMAERRARLADDLLADAERLRAHVWTPATVHHWSKDGDFLERELPTPTISDQKTLLLAAAIAIDKSQLLAGEATERSEQVSTERIVQLREALALRVVSGGAA